MNTVSKFAARSQTLGLDTSDPWALPALRILYSTPRLYQPLAHAWDKRFPGTSTALGRLCDMGFAAWQEPLIVDTTTRQVADLPSRKVTRMRLSAKGHRLLQAAQSDWRVLEDKYPKMTKDTSSALVDLLAAFNLDEASYRWGISMTQAVKNWPGSQVSAKWWIRRWVNDGVVKVLPFKAADVREVVPGHYRPTRLGSQHIKLVLEAYENWSGLSIELRLGRRSYLEDIDPARIGVAGATDYDHDSQCQSILASMVLSSSCEVSGLFAVEPRIVLPVDEAAKPFNFNPQGTGKVFYQPDAEVRETGSGSLQVRSVLEYERFQTRRDSWNHIERFLGYLSLMTLPSEKAVLRFVVDSAGRERGYVELIEAFADYALDHEERMPPNHVTLAVSSVPRLAAAADALGSGAWFTVTLPRSSGRAEPESTGCVLHDSDASPYDEYFAASA